jgi:hypothetical protein
MTLKERLSSESAVLKTLSEESREPHLWLERGKRIAEDYGYSFQISGIDL